MPGIPARAPSTPPGCFRPISNAHVHVTHLHLWPTNQWRDVSHAAMADCDRAGVPDPRWGPMDGAAVSSSQYQEFACEADVLYSTELCELESPNLVSEWFSPDERVGGDSRPHTVSPLYLCLSWSLIFIQLFKPQRKITIILVCVRLPRREAPFLQRECCPRQARRRSCPGWPGWAWTVLKGGVWGQRPFGAS